MGQNQAGRHPELVHLTGALQRAEREKTQGHHPERHEEGQNPCVRKEEEGALLCSCHRSSNSWNKPRYSNSHGGSLSHQAHAYLHWGDCGCGRGLQRAGAQRGAGNCSCSWTRNWQKGQSTKGNMFSPAEQTSSPLRIPSEPRMIQAQPPGPLQSQRRRPG